MSTLFTPNVKVITNQSQTKELFKASVPQVLNLSIIHVSSVSSVLTLAQGLYPNPRLQLELEYDYNLLPFSKGIL